jgi:hypothetical protein
MDRQDREQYYSKQEAGWKKVFFDMMVIMVLMAAAERIE